MAPTVLHMAEGQGAAKGRDVQHKNQNHGLLWRKAHDLLGVNRRQGDGHRHTGLVGHGAHQQAAVIGEVARVAPSQPQLRPHRRTSRQRAGGHGRGAFAQPHKGHTSGQSINRRGDEHGHGHELCRALTTRLRRQNISQTHAQREHAAHIAQPPAPAAHTAHGLRLRQLGQKRRCDRFAISVERIGEHQQSQGPRHLAGRHAGQGRRAQHTGQGGHHQDPFFGGVPVGPRANERHGEQDPRIRSAQAQRPRQGGPGCATGHTAHKIRREHRGDDHRGVARIGEVVHGPSPDLASANTGLEHVGHGRTQ